MFSMELQNVQKQEGDPIRFAVAGLGIGLAHARRFGSLAEFDLCACCDLSQARLDQASNEFHNVALYRDFEEMLRREKPEALIIATPNAFHCEMTVKAAEAGVSGIYCEKPIARSYGEALIMQRVCERHVTALVIGHQRRVSDPYRRMKEIIDAGLIGDLLEIRGSCAGDLISDGTHLVDSLLYLTGDQSPLWVLGQVYRGKKATAAELRLNPFLYNGYRYGHAVEEGAVGLLHFSSGLRAELQTGTLWIPENGYQHFDIFGTDGRIRKNGDGSVPRLLMDRGKGWQEIQTNEAADGFLEAARLFASSIRYGTAHPMDITTALQGLEVLMSVYESARLHSQLVLPLSQLDFPLDAMLHAGEII